MATKTTQTENTRTKLDNVVFDNPWKATFRLNKVKTVTMTGRDGQPFSYPLLEVTCTLPGNAVAAPSASPTETTPLEKGHDYLIHAFPSSFISELMTIKPENGSELTVQYHGEENTKSGLVAKIVECSSPTAADFDWDNPGF